MLPDPERGCCVEKIYSIKETSHSARGRLDFERAGSKKVFSECY